MFVKTPTVERNSIALIPESMKLIDEPSYRRHAGFVPIMMDNPKWEFAAYWHKTKLDQASVTFGLITISFWYANGGRESLSKNPFKRLKQPKLTTWQAYSDIVFPNTPRSEISYTQLLANSSPGNIDKTVYNRLGYDKPYRAGTENIKSSGHTLDFLEYYNPHHLQSLLANPTVLPPYTDGWYTINGRMG